MNKRQRSSLIENIKNSIYRMIDRASHENAVGIATGIAKSLGLKEWWANYTHIELRNRLNESAFKKTKKNERILFLPHCMRNIKKCKARYGDEGLECMECGNCKIGEIKKIAKENNYKVFIVPGGSMIKKIIMKYKPKAVLGVACHYEVNLGMNECTKAGIPSIGVLLLKDGCQNTDVNIDDVKEKMLIK